MGQADARRNFKPEQRFITPPAGDATRAFYETLYQENNDSPMAVRFIIENGTLPPDKHKGLLKQFLIYKDKGLFSSANSSKAYKKIRKIQTKFLTKNKGSVAESSSHVFKESVEDDKKRTEEEKRQTDGMDSVTEEKNGVKEEKKEITDEKREVTEKN